jgi:hypothetical protein
MPLRWTCAALRPLGLLAVLAKSPSKPHSTREDNKMRYILLAILLAMGLLLATPTYAIDGIPLTSKEQHYTRSLVRSIIVGFMCQTGGYGLNVALMKNLEANSSTPDRIEKINIAVGAEVEKTVKKTNSPNLYPEVGMIFYQTMIPWKEDRSDDHRLSCRAAGDLLVEDGVAIRLQDMLRK